MPIVRFLRPADRRARLALVGATTFAAALAAVGSAGIASALPPDPTPSCTATTCTVDFEATGGPATFTVPAGVTSITATVAGGAGGIGLTEDEDGTTEVGGAGGKVVANVPVTPGVVLTLVVGGAGEDADTTGAGGAGGGYGGGGDARSINGFSDGAGGGGSFVFDGAAPLVVAGGGGGGGFTAGIDATQGTAAGGAGGSGGDGAAGGPDATGGGAGTRAHGGAGGTVAGIDTRGSAQSTGSVRPDAVSPDGDSGSGPALNSATFGIGGTAVDGCYGAGGGGGYYGGGAGGCQQVDEDLTAYGGGGGGSGYLAAGVTSVSTGTNPGDGSIELSYANIRPTTTSLTVSPASGATTATTQTLTAQVTSTPAGDPTGSVTFYDGTQVLGTGTLSNGTAMLGVKLTAGAHQLRAVYAGAPPYTSSSSTTVTATVAAVASTASGDPLASTGADTLPIGVIAALLLLGGAGLTYAGRRRRTPNTPR